MIFHAGDSGGGRVFAARNAEVIFSAHGTDFDDALALADDIRRRLRAVGLPDDDLRTLPGTEIIVGATEEEAQEKKRWIRLQQVTPATALGIAGLLWGIDPSDRDADGPPPKEDPVVSENDSPFGARRIAGPCEVVAEWRAKAERRRRRHAAGRCARPSSHSARSAGTSALRPVWPTSSPTSYGTARSTASTSRRTSSPTASPTSSTCSSRKRKERGIYRTEYTGTTPRENLGLRAPLTHRSAPDRRQAG
ncbi:LLM class flavin-dependent oxidoreductase [Streptomyces sp. NPDC005474]|uniref:LLM class flavin-dependent oxidoreductase n=1 Tax=Streptomyces sp. NPDC005474 TaxID=3154878 RepID=UPI0034549355